MSDSLVTYLTSIIATVFLKHWFFLGTDLCPP
nr:MAG TPA: hypothetical protein [Caudoviricetes sp.]DAY75414.1 MAG TPA: hypothetical protein [Caudoviricetes sp.]DAY91489.1 MAG TPA: hypothetical protein [Caudoviricetes sp.]DAZ68192.1 MAG TPA: hypothetical protein [Caudoviricetes sp.]